jgi:hypothetical protein
VLSRSPVGNLLPEIQVATIPGTRATPILETGTVAVDSPFYEARQWDEAAARHLESTDPTVVIKGCRQSGKSSLLARLHHRAVEASLQSCYLHFQDLDQTSFQSSESLLRELARMIAEELELELDPDEFWESSSKRRGPKQVLTTFLEDRVLAPSGTGVQLLFDEVDKAFGFPQIRDELFSMIRAWHERRQRAGAKSPWKKLRLVIAHATDPTLWIEDLAQSPFNVGLRMTLQDFDEQQITDLNLKHGKPLASPEEVKRLMNLVGGHPHLVRIALYMLVTEKWDLTRLEDSASDPEGPFSNHLNYYHRVLAGSPELEQEVRRVLETGACSNRDLFQKLWVAGLILGKNPAAVRMRCRLYHDFFKLWL